MKRKKKIVYYDDPLNDDFAGTNINTQEIDKEFPFLPRFWLWRLGAWFLYYIIAIPIVFFYSLFIGGYRVRNQRDVYKRQSLLKRDTFLRYNNLFELAREFDDSIAAVLYIPENDKNINRLTVLLTVFLDKAKESNSFMDLIRCV